MTDTSSLRALAQHAGILESYTDLLGREHRVSDDVCVALLAAMGFDASSEQAASACLARLQAEQAERCIDVVRVVEEGAHDARLLPIIFPPGWLGESCGAVTITEESGVTHTLEFRHDLGDGRCTNQVLPDLPTGYHHVAVQLSSGSVEVVQEQSLIVAPRRCYSVDDRVGRRRLFGLWCNLYTLRSDQDWGSGDLTDLDCVVRETASGGGAFVGVNPLHAIRNRGDDISPYSPTSRLFGNPLYIDIDRVPELAWCAAARDFLESADAKATLERARSARDVEYDRIHELKLRVLRLLFDTFQADAHAASSNRMAAFARFVSAGGGALETFATFEAIGEHFREDGFDGCWRDWPIALRDPTSDAVEAFRVRHADRVAFHMYLQFEFDRQLGEVAKLSRDAGMPIGLYLDLAIGSADDGSDAWAYSGLVARGVEVGAPPDPYAWQGQKWGFPPLIPHRLRQDGYRYWIGLLRSVMRHAGLLRVDHVMGLFRLFWIPEGAIASEGAYVRYPAEELLGILALESQRNETVVVGEDLGTVPAEVPPALESRAILSSRVAFFEREGDGHFRAPEHYKENALVTTTTHDLPPLHGLIEGSDLKMRHQLGLIGRDEIDQMLASRQSDEIAPLLRHLDRFGLENVGASDSRGWPDPHRVLLAMHALLIATPCRLVGISLDDIATERDPVNLPGVPNSVHRNWSRRMRRPIEDLFSDSGTVQILQHLQKGMSAG